MSSYTFDGDRIGFDSEEIDARVRQVEASLNTIRFLDAKADELARPIRLNALKAEAYAAVIGQPKSSSLSAIDQEILKITRP